MNRFKIDSSYEPQGDQPAAIEKLLEGLSKNYRFQTLLGVTGSGKTYTMAKVVEDYGLPAVVMAPNKALAAQLCNEFKELFPGNAVEFFISFYDYYQPEAYLPGTDTYIEKDSSINEEIEKLRYSATDAILSRGDVIIVASVSCIYNLGSPMEYSERRVILKCGETLYMDDLISRLVGMQYERNDFSFERGTFRVKGENLDIFPAYEITY
ncbi:MAG: DEAD/DEAH box helicase family protein, partial [Actinobacteria bacterium]|nr:DEAD/DEAH box helicase family protein [Actinomycetota bacterium]